MAGGFAVCCALDRLAPPLEADGAEIGLAHLLGDAGELDVESVKREEIGPRVRRGEQDGKAAVGIAFPRDASYGVASLGLMQGPLASIARLKCAPGRLPSPWRAPQLR